MTDKIAITPVTQPITARVRPPGSKSLTNRALICAALAQGESILTGALDSEDTQVMIASLRELGIAVEASDEGRTLRVSGCGGKLPAGEASLFIENSGTSMRFLTALTTLGHGEYRLDGIARMRERPLADLSEALKQLGANIGLSETGCPPVEVHARGLTGGKVRIRGDISSQFLSALMMAAPYAATDVSIEVLGTLVSVPYVEMTRAVMESFGAKLSSDDRSQNVTVRCDSRYVGTKYDIEPDASAASYFFAAAAITKGDITVEGLHRESLQGDVAFCDCLEQIGCRVDYGENSIRVRGGELKGVDVDMNAISDTMQTLAVVALFAEGPTRIRNVAHVRHKETDRIEAVANELRKLNAEVEESEDGLVIQPGDLQPAQIATYNDHRMAMSFSLAGLVQPGIEILEPQCVSKTYPKFFQDLQDLCSQS
ncbi:MAG: 3-phosphoshikimate 1-carboxyvinyltransferase [Lacipirellulaceae bacterium]